MQPIRTGPAVIMLFCALKDNKYEVNNEGKLQHNASESIFRDPALPTSEASKQGQNQRTVSSEENI